MQQAREHDKKKNPPNQTKEEEIRKESILKRIQNNDSKDYPKF